MRFLLRFPAPVKVERLSWTKFRELRKLSPAPSSLQRSILESVSMTTTTTPWWLLLLPWRWPCQRVPTTSNPTATEVSLAQSEHHVNEFKGLTYLRLAASHRCPGQAGGGWEETDSSHSSSHNSSQENVQVSQTSVGRSSKSGGSGSHSGASRESGDLAER